MKRGSAKRILVTKLVVVILLVLIGVIAGQISPAKAQCGGQLPAEQWIWGKISYGAPQCYYSFYGRAGNYVSVWMEKDGNTPGLDPYLELKDPYGYVVAYDDESGGNGNSWIGSYRLARSGSYTIIARSYQNSTTGTFWLYRANY